MDSQQYHLGGMERLAEIDVLYTDDQKLVELAYHIVDNLEAGHLRIVDLSEITPDHRYIHIKAVRALEES